MNDRELLEMAARAIGREFDPGFTETFWNPLKCDKDAFRLAVKLEINIQHHAVDIWASTLRDTAIESRGKDDCAATRRAIVRAAASMGEQS